MTSSVLRKFLTGGQIEMAIDEVLQLAKAQNVEVAVAGGVAMQLYGSDRLTRDVDFLGTGIVDGLTGAKRLAFGGVKGTTRGGTPVDIIVRNDEVEGLYVEALATAKFVSDLKVLVVRPEYLAAMKLYADRSKDQEDLRILLYHREVELNAARKIIRQHLGAFAVKDFNSRVDEVDWLRERDARIAKTEDE